MLSLRISFDFCQAGHYPTQYHKYLHHVQKRLTPCVHKLIDKDQGTAAMNINSHISNLSSTC